MTADLLSVEAHNLVRARDIIASDKPHSFDAVKRACNVMMIYGDDIDYVRANWISKRIDDDLEIAASKRARRIRRWKLNAALACAAALIWAVYFSLKFINGGL